MAFSKVKDKNFKVHKHDEGNPAATRVKKLIFIVVALILVVGITAFLLFSPRGGAPGVAGDAPEDMVSAYASFVLPYVPPSTLSPTQVQVSQWLEFFDRPSQQWIRENAPKLSFQNARRDAEVWGQWNRARREIEAMKYLISQAPLRGGVASNSRLDEANNRAVIEQRSLDQTHHVNLVRESGGWRFADVMGQRERLDQVLAGVTLP